MKKPTATAINYNLRSWTRGVTFSLTMGRVQTYTLISLHATTGRRDVDFLLGFGHPRMNSTAMAIQKLVERGMIHDHNPRRWKGNKRNDDEPLHRLTEAGEHVIGLLKHSGIYAEVVAELEEHERRRVRLVS